MKQVHNFDWLPSFPLAYFSIFPFSSCFQLPFNDDRVKEKKNIKRSCRIFPNIVLCILKYFYGQFIFPFPPDFYNPLLLLVYKNMLVIVLRK